MVCTIILSGIWLGMTFVNPKHLYIPKEDSLSSYPYSEHATISQLILAVLCFPFVWLVFLIFYLLRKKFQNAFKNFSLWSTIWIQINSVVLSNIASLVVALFVGRVRPDFYSRCGRSSSPDTCTVLSNEEIREELHSFPSSETATAISGLLFCTLFIQAVFKQKSSYVSILALCFTVLALWIGAMFIHDYKYHTDDVVCGFFIGALCTFINWNGSKKRIFIKISNNL